MSFAAPLVLLGLLALPLLAWLHARRGRAGARAIAAFTSAPLLASVAPRRPGWRRHAPAAAIAGALALLIVAGARPQRSVAVTVPDGAVMLADDVSSSMAATDVVPSRLQAAAAAARRFIVAVPRSIRVGVLAFNERPTILQSPTTDHATAAGALSGLSAGGHTAIGDAIDIAVRSLANLRTSTGQRVPSAIVVLSDGTSNAGVDSLQAARRAVAAHIPVYTVAVGTARGTITVGHGRAARAVPVPVDGSELRQIASVSGGQAYTAGGAGSLSAVYAHLARQLSRTREHHSMSASVAGAGLVLLIAGAAMSLAWFGRPV